LSGASSSSNSTRLHAQDFGDRASDEIASEPLDLLNILRRSSEVGSNSFPSHKGLHQEEWISTVVNPLWDNIIEAGDTLDNRTASYSRGAVLPGGFPAISPSNKATSSTAKPVSITPTVGKNYAGSRTRKLGFKNIQSDFGVG